MTTLAIPIPAPPPDPPPPVMLIVAISSTILITPTPGPAKLNPLAAPIVTPVFSTSILAGITPAIGTSVGVLKLILSFPVTLSYADVSTMPCTVSDVVIASDRIACTSSTVNPAPVPPDVPPKPNCPPELALIPIIFPLP